MGDVHVFYSRNKDFALCSKQCDFISKGAHILDFRETGWCDLFI